MENRSSSIPLFRQSAEDLAQKLANIGTAESMTMAREARDLAETFRGWEKQSPDNAARIARIQQLFALHRKAMDYLAARHKARR